MIERRLPRAGEPSGSTPPRVRLPVTPAGIAAARLPRPRGFPWAAPTRPGTVPVPPAERNVGVDYDTDWARRYPARLVRAALTEGVARPAVAALTRPRVEGRDRIAALRGPAIFAANHASHIDTPLLLSVVPERWRHRMVVASAADYFFDTRVKSATFAFLLNAVPVERQRVDRKSARHLLALLEEGWSLLIYPEGGRSPDGWGQPHRAGAAWLAERTGRPLVPVHLEGTRRILPRHASRPRPGRVTVRFGRPIRPADAGARELAGRLEAAIAVLADEEATDWWSAARRAASGVTPPLTGPGDAGAWRRSWALGGDRRRPPGEARWPKP